MNDSKNRAMNYAIKDSMNRALPHRSFPALGCLPALIAQGEQSYMNLNES
ncbi:MAG: hypothetical protein ACRCZA_07965 [Shewanella sp.]